MTFLEGNPTGWGLGVRGLAFLLLETFVGGGWEDKIKSIIDGSGAHQGLDGPQTSPQAYRFQTGLFGAPRHPKNFSTFTKHCLNIFFLNYFKS